MLGSEVRAYLAGNSGVEGRDNDQRGGDGDPEGVDVDAGGRDADALGRDVDACDAHRDRGGVDDQGAGVVVDAVPAEVHNIGCTYTHMPQGLSDDA